MKKLFITIFIMIAVLASAQIEKSYFLEMWKCTSEDYESCFIFDNDLVLVTEVAEDGMVELLSWDYISREDILIIEGRKYRINIISSDTFILMPICTDKEWMENLEFKFERVEVKEDGN